MIVKERYNPRAIGVNGTITINGPTVGAFLAVTAGTLTIVNDSGGTVLNAFPVAAGQFVPLTMFVGNNGGSCNLGGGASGTLLV